MCHALKKVKERNNLWGLVSTINPNNDKGTGWQSVTSDQ